jgi:hypothetical protein
MTQPTTCPNHKVLDSLSSTLDRLEEAAWAIRQMEKHYHSANQFRWSLNGFLRTLKEVVTVLTSEVQHHRHLKAWFVSERTKLADDPIVKYLFKQRDVVVHRAMLTPTSTGFVGFTIGRRKTKLALGFPFDPMLDSADGLKNYIYFTVKHGDTFGLLHTEDDGGGEMTCVERVWRLKAFSDQEITELCGNAWEKVAQLAMDVAAKLGASVMAPKFELGDPNWIRKEIYEHKWVRETLAQAERWVKESEKR